MTIKEVAEKYQISADTLRYYERIGAIPPVTRTSSGIRDYQEEDLKWVELAKCMRSAGLPMEALVSYRELFEQGDDTIPQRLELLITPRETLLQPQAQIRDTLDRLNGKIAHYEEALQTGKLKW